MVYTHPSDAFVRGDSSRLSEIVGPRVGPKESDTSHYRQPTSGTTGQKKDTQTTTLTGAQEESSAFQAATSSENLPPQALGQIIPGKRKEPEASGSGSDQTSCSVPFRIKERLQKRQKEPVASGSGSGQPISSAPPGPVPTPYLTRRKRRKGPVTRESFLERLHRQDTGFQSISVFSVPC
jgi:hypothetical protein